MQMPDPRLDPADVEVLDGGPRYVETPPDIEHFTGWVAEPWNTASAALFIIIPLVWAWLLRGRYRQHPYLTACLPILAVGGIGGVLYHGLRTSAVYRFVDAVPIYILGISMSIWLWVRLGPKLRNLIGLIAFLAIVQMICFAQLPRHIAINISYSTLAMLVVVPLGAALWRTRFRDAGWVITAAVCFAIALLCRGVDPRRPPLLPMGTHWLWHTFGAITTTALSIYVYRIEGVPLRRRSE
jgi:hypothetical protein